MRWAWRLLYTAVWYALRWLLSRGSQEQTAELPEDTSKQVMQLQQSGAAGWIRLVIELVLLAAVLVLVIWKRREIGDALLSAWYSLRRWIQQHLRKNHAEQRNDRHEAYCDYVEDLLTAEQPAPSVAALYRRRDWKKLTAGINICRNRRNGSGWGTRCCWHGCRKKLPCRQPVRRKF